MTPIQLLEKLLKVNPVTGSLLLTGLGVVAVAAIAAGWQTNITTAGLFGLYIAGLGLFASIFANIVRDPGIQKMLGTFFAVLIMVVMSLLVVSVFFRTQGIISPPYCLVQFWASCDDIERRLTQSNSKELEARVTIPPEIVPPARDVAAVVPGNYTVFIQFAGLIVRESIVALNASLRQGGWKTQSASGERTQKAAGFNEVRFGDEADRKAAQALAEAVTATRIGSSPIVAKLVSQPKIASGTLELWVSN